MGVALTAASNLDDALGFFPFIRFFFSRNYNHVRCGFPGGEAGWSSRGLLLYFTIISTPARAGNENLDRLLDYIDLGIFRPGYHRCDFRLHSLLHDPPNLPLRRRLDADQPSCRRPFRRRFQKSWPFVRIGAPTSMIGTSLGFEEYYTGHLDEQRRKQNEKKGDEERRKQNEKKGDEELYET